MIKRLDAIALRPLFGCDSVDVEANLAIGSRSFLPSTPHVRTFA
jgi:hypothetical protein